MKEVWLVGRLFGELPGGEYRTVNGHTWELLGVYTEEPPAVARCTTDLDFVWRVELNAHLPELSEVESPERCYYPLGRHA